MKIGKLLVVGVFCSVLLITGCRKEISTDEFDINNSETVTETVKETDAADNGIPEQNTIGELSHGVDWSEDEEEYSFVYNGGQLDIPYETEGNGLATSVGFLIYLDGIPQPYMIKDAEEEYKYMHVIEGEENEEKKFVISFVPVTGKAGDKVKMSINSIVNPSFIPDMVNTFDYGMSHKSLEAVYDITFEQDAQKMPESSDAVSILDDVHNRQTDIDEEEKAYLEEKCMEAELDLDSSVYNDLIIDDNSMLIDTKQDITGKNKVHVSYIMMGHPGVKYKVNFYLDHQLLTDKTGDVYEMELETGKMNIIEFDMDVSAVKSGTFYLVAVPVNGEDYPDDGIVIMKYPSIHLYRGEN